MKNRGYTLVELLVVVAIVAILAAMIMPVLLEAKEAAKMKRCVSNLRQLGRVVQEYMDDNNGYGLPLSPTTGAYTYDNPWVLYVVPLQPYLNQDIIPPRSPWVSGKVQPNKIWICQGDIVHGPTRNDRPCWWHWGSSYLYPGPTAYLSASVSSPNVTIIKDKSIVPLRPLTWRNYKRDILLADYWYDFHGGIRVPRGNMDNPEITAQALYISKRDVKSINILFLDQHVAAVNADQREDYINYTRFDDNPYYGKQ